MNRIRALRNEMRIKQDDLCKQIGVSQGALSGWENEKFEPDMKSMKKMASIFKVSIDYLMGGEMYSDEQSRGVKIPVLGLVQAGVPIEAVEDILDYEEITPEMAQSGTYFALQVRGDSMEPRVQEGDVVIVRQQSDVDSGQVAVVLVNGECATVKRVKKQKNGILLVANNPAYEPVFYTNKEVEELPIVILGLVEELRGKSAF